MRSCKIIYFSGQLSNKIHEVFSLDRRRQPRLWKYSVPGLNLFESLMQSDRLQWKLTLDTHAKHYPLQEHSPCTTQKAWHSLNGNKVGNRHYTDFLYTEFHKQSRVCTLHVIPRVGLDIQENILAEYLVNTERQRINKRHICVSNSV